MKNIKYVISRIFKMDFKTMFKTINKISKEYKKSRIYVFFDIIHCAFKHQAGYIDYQGFKMIELNEEERKTIMTRGRNNEYVKKLNPREYWHIFDNKNEFNEKFSKYLGRDWMFLNGNNLDEFKKFLKKKKEIIVKPNDLSCGHGVRKINIKDINNIKETYDELFNSKIFLIEEVATQNKVVASLHPSSINTIRIVTIIDKNSKPVIACCIIRIGSNNKIVDNFNNDGMVAVIDKKTGEIITDAINKDGKIFKIHPTTKVKFIGVKIPKWKEITDMVLDSAMVVSEMGMIGWDVCLSEKGPTLIEGNPFPGYDLYMPISVLGNGCGVVPEFEKILK